MFYLQAHKSCRSCDTHRFPEEVARKKQWLEALDIEEVDLPKDFVVITFRMVILQNYYL